MPSHRQELEALLRMNDSIKYIRIQWTDYSGVLRARFIPVDRCLEIASGSEIIHLAQNNMVSAPRLVVPAARRLQAGHATVMSIVDQKDAPKRFDKCPRMLLFQSLKRLKAEWDAKVLVGFEIELVLLDGSDNVLHPRVRLNGYSRTAGLRGETLKLVEEIAEALEESCIKIHRFHTDVQGKLEIALAPEPALEGVDSLVLAQEAIRAICVRRNLKAATTPKPTLSGPSNGLHLHLSIGKLEQALVDHFLAGVLNHMGALCAFGMANHNSYVRSTSNAAGAWIGFGTDNRDLPVRKISDQHWEFRMMDSTANPYLFTAAILLAGLDGLEHKQN
ncbi:hypothetical protein PENFLA_c002G04420 [Penicillium flavigenum]|uniref:GS catalytic domain-containing protein n=1 Tax=Penicillium flavigenum TaxID=254877 RepID=A0A1V6TY34_9EURO|nr:hypothetical protein PENFLA_c002G04420 [Penicillium flavigenum]